LSCREPLVPPANGCSARIAPVRSGSSANMPAAGGCGRTASRARSSSVAAKTISAYIDLNPVRAGMTKDPADYRWSSYGEAIGGGSKGNGKTARAGLVRALRAHQGVAADGDLWASGVSREYRKLLMSGAMEKSAESMGRDGVVVSQTLRKGISRAEVDWQGGTDGDIP